MSRWIESRVGRCDRPPARFCGLLLAALLGAAPALADWKAEVGYAALRARLGAAAPTGAGVSVTQAEAPDGSGNYLPDAADPQFVGKTIVPRTSGATGGSTHATSVARTLYGLTAGLAPGVSYIDAYDANHWLSVGFLMTQTLAAPAVENRRVQNHSWVGGSREESRNLDMLRRIDLVVERDGVVVVAGVNNGAGSAVPKLLAGAYNVVSVGLTSGNSSYGPTIIDAAGRVKPDLVAPAGQTSASTPMVAAAAALLVESADAAGTLPGLSGCDRRSAEALLVKALLMGGATKGEFADWRRGFATPAADGSVPLDYRYGAGELNVDNSHRILTAGEQDAGDAAIVSLTGWDFATARAGRTHRYFFEVPTGFYAHEVSILAAWNRHVATGPGSPLVLTPSLADLNLGLCRADGFAAGLEVDRSVSSLDNVEHIYLPGMAGGRHVIEVAADRDVKYALTWDISLAPAPAADFDGDGDIDAADLNRFRSCVTGPGVPYDPAVLPPACPAGSSGSTIPADFDRDRDVDQSDFGVFQVCLGASGVLPPPPCLAGPPPR